MFAVIIVVVRFPNRPGESALQMERPNNAKVCGQGRLSISIEKDGEARVQCTSG